MIEPHFMEEEERLAEKLESVSHLKHMAINRDPESTKSIAVSGRNALQSLENFLTEIQETHNPPRIDDRIQLVRDAKTRLRIFQINPEIISSNYQPPINEVATDSQLLEVVMGNLYCSVHYLNEIRDGKPPQEVLMELSNVVRNYELEFVGRHPFHGRTVRIRNVDDYDCLGCSDPFAGARFVYAYETLCDPGALKKVMREGDYSLLYGKEGIHLEVKNIRLFGNRKNLSRMNSRSIRNKGRFYFPVMREFFLDVIPKFNLPYSS